MQLQISQHYDDAVESSHEILAELKNGKKQLENIQGKINALLTSCARHYDQAQNGAVSLINIFRNTVQQIYNDPNSFLYNDALLNKENGLTKLNFSQSRNEVEGLLLNTIQHFQKMENEFPAKQDALLDELVVEQTKYLDEAEIDSMIQQIRDRKEKQSADLKESKLINANP